ncbi:MAG: hypothetical protein AAFQ37_05375 [Bacteroidota bacterium]
MPLAILFYIYLLIGLLFGLWFVFLGVQRLDSGMNGAKWTMRLLLLPGAIGLWPVLLRKFFTAR